MINVSQSLVLLLSVMYYLVPLFFIKNVMSYVCLVAMEEGEGVHHSKTKLNICPKLNVLPT